MAKKFISFLGTGKYQLCKYKLQADMSNEVVFIQEALVSFLCKDFSKDDSICIFVTPEAKRTHWTGLQERLTKMDLGCEIQCIDIQDSKSEADIWNLFETLYNAIEKEDSVIFDLTHSFRYLPMLFFSILNYAQYLKNITVDGIYYGAYEARTDDNIAPVFDMTNAYQVLQWASAADMFSNYGIADRLYQQIKAQDMEFSDSGKLSDSILKMTRNMNYARGQRIVEGKMFSHCAEKIGIYKYSADIVKHNPILLPVLDSVEEKIKEFKENSTLNFLPATKWYIDHDMPAEAISMLKEGIVTFLLERAGEDYKKVKLRLTLGNRLAFSSNKTFEYDGKSLQFKSIIEDIMDTSLAKNCKDVIEKFNSFRNDIDHSGFIEQARSPENIIKEIRAAYDKIIEVFVIERILE